MVITPTHPSPFGGGGLLALVFVSALSFALCEKIVFLRGEGALCRISVHTPKGAIRGVVSHFNIEIWDFV